MVRTQVQLTRQQVARLKRSAAAQGVSMAEVVRRLVDQGLREEGADRTHLYSRAAALVGALKDRHNAGDLSAEHDAYLAGERE